MTATDLQPRVEETFVPVATQREGRGVTGPPQAVRWPWVVAGVSAGVAFLVLMAFLAMGWHLGTSPDPAATPRHSSELLALVQGIQNLVVLTIAAVLGVGAMKRTAAAVRLAALHKIEADRQRASAQQQHDAAAHNLELAHAQTRRLAEVQRVLDDVVAHAESRTGDNSRFVTNLEACADPADPADPQRYRHLLVRSDAFSRVDPELARLAAHARALLREIRTSNVA
jgi:hypothetical protein